MKRLLVATLLLITSLNLYAIDCFVAGKEFTIENANTSEKQTTSGNLTNCEKWKVSSGVVAVVSPSGSYEKSVGEYLVKKKSNSHFANFLAFVTGETDKTHEGVQQFGDGIELFFMPANGYVESTTSLALNKNQFYQKGDKNVSFTISKFSINNRATSVFKQDKIIVSNLNPGKTYKWIAYNRLGGKATGRFTVNTATDQKDFEKDLSERLKAKSPVSQVASDLIKAEVMYDWELYYDAKMLISSYLKEGLL